MAKSDTKIVDHDSEVVEKRKRRLGFGGRPLHPREIELVNEVLDSGRIYNAEFTRRFEEAVAEVHGKRLAIFVNSGTSALDLAVHALKRTRGWKDDDEVIVPAVTFVASVVPIIKMGLKPVFVDIDPEHFDLDVDQIERHITPRTRGIVAVHLLGQICNIEPLMDVAKEKNLAVIEDACETMFVKRNGMVSGSWGDVVCFSTFMVHMISTGIGGFAATDDIDLGVKIKQLANHGNRSFQVEFTEAGRPCWDSSINHTKGMPLSSYGEEYDDIGYSFRASELEAAIGVAQMERWSEILHTYQQNAERLTAELSDLEHLLQLPKPRTGNEHGYFRYGLVLKDDSVDRDQFARYLLDNGISARWIFPLINQPAYLELYGDLEPKYPNAAHVNHRGLLLTCHDGLTLDDMDYYSDVIHNFFSRV